MRLQIKFSKGLSSTVLYRLEFKVQCHYCNTDVRGVKCGTCKMQALQCVICHKGVRGEYNYEGYIHVS